MTALLTPAMVFAAHNPIRAAAGPQPGDDPRYFATYSAECPACGCDASWSTSSDPRIEVLVECWCCDVARVCTAAGRHRAPAPAGATP